MHVCTHTHGYKCKEKGLEVYTLKLLAVRLLEAEFKLGGGGRRNEALHLPLSTSKEALGCLMFIIMNSYPAYKIESVLKTRG